ncbi:hypothetical protein ACGC1H_004160 [Rhizoctonia solani]
MIESACSATCSLKSGDRIESSSDRATRLLASWATMNDIPPVLSLVASFSSCSPESSPTLVSTKHPCVKPSAGRSMISNASMRVSALELVPVDGKIGVLSDTSSGKHDRLPRSMAGNESKARSDRSARPYSTLRDWLEFPSLRDSFRDSPCAVACWSPTVNEGLAMSSNSTICECKVDGLPIIPIIFGPTLTESPLGCSLRGDIPDSDAVTYAVVSVSWECPNLTTRSDETSPYLGSGSGRSVAGEKNESNPIPRAPLVGFGCMFAGGANRARPSWFVRSA